MSRRTPPKEGFTLSLLLPKYWLLWLFFVLLRLIILLPYQKLEILAGKITPLLMKAQKRRVEITKINLRLCFPSKSETERHRLLEESFRFMVMGIFEMGLAWWASDKKIKSLYKINNLEVITNALSQKKGTIGISAHFTQVELFMRIMGAYIPLTVFYRRQKNDLFEYFSVKKRERYLTRLVERKDVRGFFSALERGELVAYLPDQDFGIRNGIFAPFFGIQAATITALTDKLSRPGTPFIASFIHRNKNNNRRPYEINCYDMKDYPSGDPLKDATRMNALIEKEIRGYPEQYMWQHRRFKTRPEGEERIY